ncbi:GTPase [Corynebacterium sp. H113]|uniref:GTPase n=1 Tax=Corynebacterium sp. H113 TaxID=3133419 RepID=UPI0030A41507
MSDSVTRLFNQALDALARGGGDLPERAESMRSVLLSPPQVVIVGRLKAGKSTLVNALTGSKVAATAALECTNAVSIYRNGSPSRAEVVGIDGQRLRQDLVGGMLTELPLPVERVAYVDRFLPSRALEGISLIDTPGLATLTTANADATHRALIDGFDQTAEAAVDADAVVFLFDTAPRKDELEFLNKLGFTPLNSIGVLNRADSFGEGAMGRTDPIQDAASHCHHMSRELADSVYTVIPMAGLLAESSRSGSVTQAVSRLLVRLADLDRESMLEELESEEPTTISGTDRDMLLDILGEYGVIYGARVAAESGAIGLANWMQTQSGIGALEEKLHTEVLPQAVLQRSARLIDELDRLAYTHPQRDHIRQVLHILTTRPEMYRINLFRSFRGLLLSSPDSRLVTIVAKLLGTGSIGERVGAAVDASPDDVVLRCQELIASLQTMAMSTLSAAEEDARTASILTLRSIMQSIQA